MTDKVRDLMQSLYVYFDSKDNPDRVQELVTEAMNWLDEQFAKEGINAQMDSDCGAEPNDNENGCDD